jgi:succinyl-CoA:(S)-malate CoA-transferase subunit A
MRRFGTPTVRPDATLAWLSEDRNKKSVTCDLRQPEGVQLFLRLVEKSDVLIENFRPGTMEEWGLGWDVLHAANPKLVMLRVSGYGQTGPYRRRSGFAQIAQAFGGLNYLAGFPGRNTGAAGHGAAGRLRCQPVRRDRGADRTAPRRANRARAGHRRRHLRGGLSVAGGDRRGLRLHGKVREREGSGSFVACPARPLPHKDDKWIAIACTTDKMFERLAVTMGRSELASAGQYGSQRKRLAARDTVNQIVIEWVGSLDRDEVLQRCLDEEVPVGKVNSIADIFEDEHFQRSRQPGAHQRR